MSTRQPTFRAPFWSRPRERAIGLYLCAAAFALVMGLASVLDPVMAITAFLGIVAIGMFLPRGEVAVAAFAASTFFEVVSANVGLSLTPVKLLGAVVITTSMLMLLTRSREVPVSAWRHHPFIVTMSLILVGWAIASVSWAVEVSQVQSLGVRLVMDVVVMFSIPLIVRRVRDLRLLGWWIVAASLLGAGMGLVLGTNLFGRAIGMFSDPNEFASATVVAAGFALALGETSSSRLITWIGRASAGGLFVLVAMSASRTGMMAAVALFIVLVMTARGVERLRLAGLTVTAISLVVAWLVLSPAGAAVLERVTTEGSTGRTDLWRVAQYQFQDKPVHGVGLGNYPVVSSQYLTRDVQNTDLFIRAPRTVHNTPLELLAELGIVGFVAFYGIVMGMLVIARRNVQRAHELGDPMLIGAMRGIAAGTVALLASSLTLSALYVELQWVLFGAIIASASIIRERIARAAHEDAIAAIRVDQSLLIDEAVQLDDAALLDDEMATPQIVS